MSTIYDDDVFVVESNGQQYNVQNQNRSSLSDDDLFLVERNGTLYKVAASDVGTGGGGGVTGSFETPVQVLTPLNGAGLNDGAAYEPISSPITAVGAAGSETYTTSDITTVTEVRENLVVSTNGTLTPQNIFDGRWDTSTGTNTGACVTNFENMKVPSLHSVFVRCLGGSNSSTGTTTITFVGGGSSTISQPGTAGITNIYRNDTAEDVFLEKITQSRKSGSWAYFDAIAIVPDSAGLPTSKGQIVEIADVQPYTAMWGPSGLSRDGTELTFENSTNFDKFQVGDVVQASDFIFPFQTTDLSNSAGPTGVVTNPANAYDGDLTKGALGGGATTWMQFNLNPYGINVKTGDVVTVYLRNEFLIGNTGNIGDTILKFVDGSEITGTGVSGTDPVEHIDLIVDGQKTIQYIKHYTTNSNTRQPAISGIALNGMLLLGEDYKDKTDLVSVVSVDDPNSQMLVDGGEWIGSDGSQTDGVVLGWNQSTLWSDLVQGTLDTQFGASDPKVAFSPTIGTQYFDGIRPTDGNYLTMDFTQFPNAKKLRVYAYSALSGANSDNLKINGVAIGPTEWADGGGSQDGVNDGVEFDLTDGLTKLEWGYGINGGYVYLCGLEVDGQQLVDSNYSGGPTPVGDTNLSKTVSYDASLTCTDSSELSNMVGPISMTDENGDLVTPQTSEIVSVGDGTYSGNTVYTNGSESAGSGPDKLFDGNLNTATYLPGPGEPGVTLTTTFPGNGIPIQNKLEYYIGSSSVKIEGLVSVTANNGSSSEEFTTGWHEIPNPPESLTSLAFNNKAFGDSWNPGAIRIDGEILTETAGAKLLTFTDSTDLEYFQPGDVLVDTVDNRIYSDSFIEGQPNAGFPTNTFDGNAGIGSAYNNYGVVTTAERACVFDPPIEFKGGTIRVAAYSTGGSVPWVVYIDGVAYEKQVAAGTTLVWNELTDLPAGKIESFGMASNANAWGQVQLNGVDLIDGDGTYVQGVEVVSVDPDNNQMVVNGGTWDTANRSQVWSDVVTASDGDILKRVFDGDVSTFMTTNVGVGQKIELTFPAGVLESNEIEIYDINGDSGCEWSLDDVTYSFGSPASYFVLGTGSSTQTKLYAKSTNGAYGAVFIAIKVNGKQLIDATLNGEVWSSTEFCTQGAEGDGGYSSDRAFSGELIGEQVWYPPQNGEAKFITGDRFDSATKLEFSYSRLGGGPTLKVNNNTLNLAEGIGVKHSMDLPNGFRSLTFNYVGAGNYYGIQWIKIDGMLLIDKGVGPDTGENKVTGSTLQASATDVNGVDGNKLLIDGVSGTWLEGLHIKGSEITGSAPSPTDVVFTSMNGGTTDVTGTDATLSSRVWTLEKSDNQSGPWTQVATYVDTSANASQDGATPWADKPTLEANKYYQVRVKYTSNNANPVESTSNTFKTGD